MKSEIELITSDKLITFQEVNVLLGINSRFSSTVRSYAKQGKIRSVKLNNRVIRYSRDSVLALISGKGAV